MSTDTTPAEPSGLTVDGIAVPLSVEAAGAEAIDAHLAASSGAAPFVPESPANPPTLAEGKED